MLDKKLLDILACPICKTEVTYDEAAQKIICSQCGRKFPVRDDIPVMLESESEK